MFDGESFVQVIGNKELETRMVQTIFRYCLQTPLPSATTSSSEQLHQLTRCCFCVALSCKCNTDHILSVSHCVLHAFLTWTLSLFLIQSNLIIKQQSLKPTGFSIQQDLISVATSNCPINMKKNSTFLLKNDPLFVLLNSHRLLI